MQSVFSLASRQKGGWRKRGAVDRDGELKTYAVGIRCNTTAIYAHVATKTIRGTVSPFETLKKLQDQTLRRGLE